VEGKFTPRGGLNSTVTAQYNRESGGIGAGFRPGKG
jgi:hypothetical protein